MGVNVGVSEAVTVGGMTVWVAVVEGIAVELGNAGLRQPVSNASNVKALPQAGCGNLDMDLIICGDKERGNESMVMSLRTVPHTLF